MKNLYSFIFGVMSICGFSQCEILGNSTLNIGETAMYHISNDLAQCKKCHQWSSSGNVNILSDPRLNHIVVKASTAGKNTIQLQYFSQNSLVKCSKNIEIISSGNNFTTGKDEACDIRLPDIKEIKVTPNKIAFFPDTEQELVFHWEAHFQNGNIETSTEKVPHFTIINNNPILRVECKVFSKTCYSKFSKNYDSNFWNNLK